MTTNTTPQLRPYQSRAVAAVQRHWSRGTRRVCVVLPTGTGKTVVARALQPDLAIVHTSELQSQTRRTIPGIAVRTIHEILRAGLPIAGRRGMVVFIDECHHIAAGTWRTILDLLPADVLVVGVTATPERADGTPLGDVFGAMVSTITYSQALRAGYLAPCRVVRPTAKLTPAAAYLAHGARRPGVIFAPTIAACNATVVELHAAEVRAAAITASTPAAAREWAVRAFADGQLDVLASPMALAEGFDAPRAAVAVLARKCQHVSTYLQMVNRVTRPHASKGASTPALVVDLTGASARHGHPLEDRTYSLAGRGIRRAVPTPRAAAARRPVAPARAGGVAVGSALRSIWGMILGAMRAAA